MSFFLKSIGIRWQMFKLFFFPVCVFLFIYLFIETVVPCRSQSECKRQRSLPRAIGVLAGERLLNWALNEVCENSVLCLPLVTWLIGPFVGV